MAPQTTGADLFERLDEYLNAGMPMVWIVNPERRTIRVYRNDDTAKLFRGQEVIEDEPLLPGFRMIVAEVFPEAR